MSYLNWGIWAAENIPEVFRVKAWASAALVSKVPPWPKHSVPTEGKSNEKRGSWFSVATLWARAMRSMGPYESTFRMLAWSLGLNKGHSVALPIIDTSTFPSVLLSVTCEKPPLRRQAPPLTPGLQPFPQTSKRFLRNCQSLGVRCFRSLIAQEKYLFGTTFFMPGWLQGVYATYGELLPLR